MKSVVISAQAEDVAARFLEGVMYSSLFMSTSEREPSSQSKRRAEAWDISDAELLEDVRAGNMQACGTIVERYQRLLYSIAYGLMGDHGEADDVVQQVFIRFFEKVDRVRKAKALKTYLARSTTNECIDRLRRAKRRPTVSLDALETSETLPLEDGLTPQENMRRKRIAERIRWALEQLSVRQRRVIVLSLSEGLSYTEIAEIIGCEEVTVRTHLHRARKRLQELLGPWLDELETGIGR